MTEKPVRQCKKCPWRKDVDPRDIPNGYCEMKHRALDATIARGPNVGHPLRLMACHETPVDRERPCVGWLANQLGPGNNIALRLWYTSESRLGITRRFETVGEQHACFEDTQPASEPAA